MPLCAGCLSELPKSTYSSSQLKKGKERRCASCAATKKDSETTESTASCAPPTANATQPNATKVRSDMPDKEKGNAAFAAGEFDEAITYYTAALESTPSDHVLWCNRSMAWARLEDWPSSAADARKCVSLPSGRQFVKGWWRLARAQQAMGMPVKATESCLLGLQKNPDNRDLRTLQASLQPEYTRAVESDSLHAILQAGNGKGPVTRAAKQLHDGDDISEIELSEFVKLDAPYLLRVATKATLVSQRSELPGFACQALENLALEGISEYIVRNWPKVERSEYFNSYLSGEESSPFTSLILSDGLNGFDALLDWVCKRTSRDDRAASILNDLVAKSKDGRIPIWTSDDEMVEFDIRDGAVEILAHMLPSLDLPRLHRLVREACFVLQTADKDPTFNDWPFTKHVSHRFYTSLVDLLVKAQRVSPRIDVLPYLRRAFMMDLVDLNMWGDWGGFLQDKFRRFPDTDMDTKLLLTTKRIREGRRQYNILRFDLRNAATRHLLPPREEDLFNPDDPKCTRYWCCQLESLSSRHPVTCEICNARYCSTECKEADRRGHAQVCKAGRYPCVAGAASSEQADKLHSCSTCNRKETAKRQFRKCARCRLVHYCSPFCQQHAWHNGHKEECMRNNGLRVKHSATQTADE